MILYHMSDTLCVGDVLKRDFKDNLSLAEPFVKALSVSEECFNSVFLSAKYLRASLKKFGLCDMQTDHIKWAAEGIFEYIRRAEFPKLPCRLTGSYFFDSIENCRELFEEDWGSASEEERSKIRLFEVELNDSAPRKFDMRLFDEAYDLLWENENPAEIIPIARKYFSGEIIGTAEILSEAPARVIRDITEQLR